MYCALLIVTIALAGVWADADEDKSKCIQALNPGTFRCCNKGPNNMGLPISPEALHRDEALKECFQLPEMMESCAREICIGNKRGIVSLDGNVDLASVKSNVERDFKESPELVTKIVQNCINNGFSKFGSDDMCDIMKLKQCLELQILSMCTEWNNEPPCTGSKDIIDKCSEIYA
ncbi:uncharacterized protein LOC131849506 [Achroia grisella]|uniref:uncharacterized protein LOC131849506 n=1 Tax=Achroia grisella TaxID=688607 RepID=UPI0027D25856|nr:uncharacterized protein LOC131849506 [Achroia grisella]